MSIQVNTGATPVSWELLLSSLGDVEKTGAADGRSEFTITTKVGGEVKTTTVSIPDDLDIPKDVDKGTLDALVDKLAATGLGFTDEQIATMKDSIAQLGGKVAAAVGEVNQKSSGKVFFDLYALLALMIDVAQTQRDAAREMRTAENLSIQKAIQNQADIQRDSASTAMLVGIICGAASALVSAGMMIGQGVYTSKQSTIAAQSGADSAKMHSASLQTSVDKTRAQTNFDTVSAKVGDEVATRVTDDFSAQLVDDQYGDLKANLDTAVENHETAKAELSTKEQALETAKTTLDDMTTAKANAEADYQAKSAAVQDKQSVLDQKQAAYDKAVSGEAKTNNVFGQNSGTKQVNDAKAELDAAKADLQAAKDAQAASKTTLDNATKDVQDQTQVVANAQRDVGLAGDKVSQTSTAMNKARTDYSKTVQDVAAQYEEKYQNAVDRLNNPEPGDNVADLEAAVKSARADMEMAYATEAKLLSEDNVMTQSEQKDLVRDARGRVDETMDRVYRRSDFKSAERKIAIFTGVNGIIQAAGGVAQSAIQNDASAKSAEATRQGAETKAEEEMLDQTKDLFSQEQKLIDQVVQLFSAVIQAENQSMRDAIQA